MLILTPIVILSIRPLSAPTGRPWLKKGDAEKRFESSRAGREVLNDQSLILSLEFTPDSSPTLNLTVTLTLTPIRGQS